MSISAIIQKLQSIHAGIEGIVSAPISMPGSLSPADLPAILVYPAEADWSVPFYAGSAENRIYLVRIYVAPISLGKGVDEGFQNTLPFIDRLGEAYHRPENIAPPTGEWQELHIESDSGVRADLRLHGSGDQAYWGVEFRVRIKSKRQI